MNEIDRLRAEVRRLRDENDELKAELARVRNVIQDAPDPYMVAFGLTATQAAMMGLLMDRPLVPINALTVAGRPSNGFEERTVDTVRVIVSKMRKTMRRHGIEIGLHYGKGYSISADGKARVREMVEVAAAGGVVLEAAQ